MVRAFTAYNVVMKYPGGSRKHMFIDGNSSLGAIAYPQRPVMALPGSLRGSRGDMIFLAVSCFRLFHTIRNRSFSETDPRARGHERALQRSDPDLDQDRDPRDSPIKKEDLPNSHVTSEMGSDLDQE
mgnify:CR=1 FL=1